MNIVGKVVSLEADYCYRLILDLHCHFLLSRQKYEDFMFKELNTSRQDCKKKCFFFVSSVRFTYAKN